MAMASATPRAQAARPTNPSRATTPLVMAPDRGRTHSRAGPGARRAHAPRRAGHRSAAIVVAAPPASSSGRLAPLGGSRRSVARTARWLAGDVAQGLGPLAEGGSNRDGMWIVP